MNVGMEVKTKSHYLLPAALFASDEPVLVNTILGSCVSVCLWDPRLQIGGINHFMLPLWNGKGLPSPKYGNIAIQKLLERMLYLGCEQAELQAKVFGGGEILVTTHDSFQIGQRNIGIAFDLLKELRIPVKGQSVGGSYGRKILFDTFTGLVRQKYVKKT